MPLPLPLPPEVIVIHGTPLDADHEQPPPAVIPTLFLAPPAGTLTFGGDNEIAQPLAWLTVNVWPPIVSTPDRAGPEEASTV